MLGGAGSPGGDDLLTVTVVRDEHGYGMKVSGDNPVFVQSVKEHGAAWRAGLRAGDRILRVDSIPVHHHTHQQVVHMIRANPTTVLTVQQNMSRHKTPITAPLPVNSEKQRQLGVSKVHTMRLMLEEEQKYIRDLRNELSKVPDVRKQAQLEAAEHRCSKLQHEIDSSMAGQPEPSSPAPSTPRLNARNRSSLDKSPITSNTGFLSGLPRSLSNLTGQSLRNLRQARQAKNQQEYQPPLVRQNSDDDTKRRHHNNTVPIVPTTCLDNVTPPPLPPRSIERPKRTPLSPPTTPVNPLAKPKPSASSQMKRYYPDNQFPMHQSMPGYNDNSKQFRRSSHSLDGELEGPQPNSIALQMSYPLVNLPPPPLQTDNRNSVPVLHMRSRSSPEQLDCELSRSNTMPGPPSAPPGAAWTPPPPGTPPPPYHTNTQPCSDPQRAIISMEEDDSPASDNSTYSGLFSNLRSVRESKARTAVLLNWLLGERRCACASLLLILTDAYRSASGVTPATLRRWAYEIHSTFLMPNAVLQLNGVDENMANEIEHILVNEHDKEELLRNVFRKARQKAKEELSQQLTEFQVKRQVGLGTLYGPHDAVLEKCDVDKAQELVVVEQVLTSQLRAVSDPAAPPPTAPPAPHGARDTQHTLLAALIAAALALHCRPASVAAAVGGTRASFLQRDKLYKQRVKQLTKQHPQPFVVRGHHLQLQALTSVAHCHHCDNVIWGLAPQAYVCTDCKLRVHRACARGVEEGCCLDQEHHSNRISRFMERMHNNQNNVQDINDKKSRKTSGAAHFLNMERSFRKAEDESPWELINPASQERRTESDESLYESADGHSDAVSASDDAIPRLKTPAISKESLKLAITDEEVEIRKKGHRKTMSLSNPLEIVKNLGDELLRDFDKNNDKKKSRESLWSEEDRDSIHGSTIKLDQSRKDSKKDRKISTTDPPKSRKSSKGSSVSALNFLRRKKTPTSIKPIESVAEDGVKVLTIEEILNYTKLFLECEIRHSSTCLYRPPVETDSEDEGPTPKQKAEHRRRLSRQTSRSKSKVRGKSQSLKVNTLRKSHSGTLKKSKKQKSAKTPMSRSRQSSVVEHNMPVVKKKSSESMRHSSWLFSGYRDSRREGSTDEPTAPDTDLDVNDFNSKDPDKETNSHRTAPPVGRGVNRAESCRERDAPRRGKHRNASDPNRLTAHNNHDLEPGAPTAPSGSSSSSSLSSRSNESNTVVAEQQGTQSELSEEDEPLASAWASSVPASVLDALSARLRKRQEVIHELILSEGSHVRWLKVLGGVFLRGLESQPGLLPPDELKALFPNLPAVKERHQRLYAALKALRAAPAQPVVTIRSLADAILDTLGDPGYAPCLSRFCSGQRLALDVLRERRRKHKELHQFLCSKEQLPLCGRLQLKDLLACVWQRLTKYMLLLENILKTVDESDNESDEDVSRLRRALDVAKDVLHGVDSAIRNTENEHRLRSIQQKLEVRVPHGADWDEVRRLDLTHRALRLEGDLMLRGDAAKKIHVTALMFEDSLVLLQREGDKYILKPIPSNTSQQQPLSPLVKWDKVLFRPNAAVRNTFFLMSINRIQMHELSANTAQEYATWVKHIEEAPLAKLTELKSSLTHQTPCKPVDETVTNVSRNPSDASEKGSTTLASEEPELERDRASVERSSVESERDDNSSVKTDDRPSVDKEELSDREEKNIPRRPTVGCITTHVAPPPAPLQPPPEVNDPPHPLHTATTVCSPAEYLRRLDSQIRRLMSLRRDAVADMLCVPRRDYAQVAELCVADTLGNVDITTELRASGDRLSHSHSVEQDGDTEPDMNQLLLATFAQADEILSCVRRAMHVNEHDMMRARTRPHKSPEACGAEVTSRHVSDDVRRRVELCGACSDACDVGMQLPDDGDESSDCIETPISSAELACRLSSAALGLQDTTRRLLLASTAPPAPPALRAHLAALSETNHRLAHRATRAQPPSDIISDTEATPDTTIQEQPSNGG